MAKKKQVGNRGTTAAVAGPITVAHGLGSTPTAVIVQVKETGASDIYVDTVGATEFNINYTNGGGNNSFDWLALV